ncbi:Crp/Fnr family transcriptional regulator [Thermodesulfobacteriota bacterium]
MSTIDNLFEKFGKAFEKGTILFEDGDDSKEMYIIQSGKVKITKQFKDLEETLVIFEEGDFFGEMATLNDKPRSANATVMEESSLLVIDPDTFEAMISNSNEVALRMIKKLAERLQETDDLIEKLLHKDYNSKVMTTLIRIAYDLGDERDSNIKIKISLTKLAAQTGINKGKIKNVIHELVKRGIVKVEPEGLVVSSIKDMSKFLYYLTQKGT